MTAAALLALRERLLHLTWDAWLTDDTSVEWIKS